MSLWNRLFGRGRERASDHGAGKPASAKLQDAPPTTAPTAAANNQDMAAVGTDEASRLRQGILNRHPLTKCCELPSEPRKSGTPDLGLQRVVLYRWDGNPIPTEQLDSLILKFLTVRAEKDARFVPVRNAFAAKSVPCPRVGFSIKLEADEVTVTCELLATTEYAGPDANFNTTGHGFGDDNVSYRIYFYWNP